MTAEDMEEVEITDDVEDEEDLVDAEVDAQGASGVEEEAETEAADKNSTPRAAPAAAAAAADEEAVERETDDAGKTGGQRPGQEVTISAADTTLDAFYDAERCILSSLSDGGFQHLLSGARANTGATSGRHLYEVQLLSSVLRAKTVFKIGFSTAGSSLFLGDASGESCGFDSSGDFLSEGQRTKAAKSMGKKVVGVLLNLDKASPNVNTISLFVDGVRAGKPQPIPSKLIGKALFPTITFMNVTLAVNFGRAQRQLRLLPFRCTMFSDVVKADCEQSTAKAASDGSFEVVVPVGLPEQGVFDFVDAFRAARPGFEELSDRRLLEWCRASGLQVQEAAGAHSSRDCVDSPSFGLPAGVLDGKLLRPMLQTLALLARRDVVVCEVSASLLKTRRKELISQLPSGARTSAIVVMGQPKDPSILKPSKEGDLPDVSEKALSSYSQFCLPSEEEGFGKVDFEWLGKNAAEAHLKAWILERKSTTIITDLQPGEWFKAKLAAWHGARSDMRTRTIEYGKKRKETPGLDAGASFDIKGVTIEDVNNIDSKGTPLFANFKFEDWVLLGWRYELHLLAHAFAVDVADPERPGIPEEQLPHYYNIYFKTKCDPAKLGCDSLQKAFKLLKLPALELAAKDGGKVKILCSRLDKELPLKDFIIGVESYRRDRIRRIDAGDESAQLMFPKPAQPPKGAPPGKAPTGAKPLAARPSGALAPRPVVKAVSKTPAPGPRTAAPGAAAAAGAGAVKRPMPPSMPPPGVMKKPRVEGGAPAPWAGKAPVAKMAIAKVAITKAPVAKRPPPM